MKTKEIILNSLHKIVRKDQYINDLLIAPGSHLDLIKEKKEYLKKEFLFSTMSLERIEALEKELNYKVKAESLEGKRIEIEARWKTTGKCDLELLQQLANNWRNGEVKVTFEDAEIKLKFISIIGIPNDLESFKKVINEAIPAHLGSKYIITYRVWRTLEKFTWNEIGSYTWDEVRNKEGILDKLEV